MNVVLIFLASTLGSLAGACINYAFALLVGRPFLERYGRLFLRPAAVCCVRPTPCSPAAG